MAKSTARKSAPAAVVAILPPGPAPTAAQIAWGETFDALESSEGVARDAMVRGFRTAAEFGTPEPELAKSRWPSCNNPAVYLSNFSRATKAAQVIGTAGTLEVIAGAVAIEGGRAMQKILDALAAVMKAGKARADNGHKGEATGNARGLIIAGALREAGKAQDARDAGPKPGKAGKAPKAGAVKVTKVATVRETVAAYVASGATLHKLAKPEGVSQRKWAEFRKAVALAGELALAIFPAK